MNPDEVSLMATGGRDRGISENADERCEVKEGETGVDGEISLGLKGTRARLSEAGRRERLKTTLPKPGVWV
jgi:hypothetical protein